MREWLKSFGVLCLIGACGAAMVGILWTLLYLPEPYNWITYGAIVIVCLTMLVHYFRVM